MLDTLNGHPVQQAYNNITSILYLFPVWHPVVFWLSNFINQLRGLVIFFVTLLINYVDLIGNEEIYYNT